MNLPAVIGQWYTFKPTVASVRLFGDIEAFTPSFDVTVLINSKCPIMCVGVITGPEARTYIVYIGTTKQGASAEFCLGYKQTRKWLKVSC